MSNQLSEQKVLEILDIPDFRHMSKDKVMQFASMLGDMQPEVAMKALEQFPEFAKTVLELATDYKQTIEKSLDGNTESMQAYKDMLQSIIESLQTQLEKEDIPFEERKYYINKMFEAEQRLSQKDADNKEFYLKVMRIAGAAMLTLGGVVVAALGGKIDFKLPLKK